MTEVEPTATSEAASSGERAPDDAISNRWRGAIARLTVAVAVIVVMIDQATKYWALDTLSDGRDRHVIWTLQWNLAFNSGMAFSRGDGLGPFIAVLAVLVVVALVVTSARVESRLGRVAAGMLVGGAFGNLLDRAFRGRGWLHGSVIDFIDLQWWPIFNVADMGITIGAILFASSALFVAPTVAPTDTMRTS